MNIVKKLRGHSFVSNVSIIMSGSILSQLVTLFSAPVLSRVFSPADFGIFAFYTSIVSILSVVITFRYELSIVIPKSERDSITLLLLSITFSFINSFLIFIILFFINGSIANFAGINEFIDIYYFIPFIVFLIGIYNSLKYWNIRKEMFKRTTTTDITNSLITNITQVSLGLLNISFFGLILGKLLGQFIATIIMLIQVFKEDIKKIVGGFSFSRMVENLKEHKDFPIYGTPQALFSSLSINMVPILMIFFFNTVAVGYYALALRVLQMPINLIGNAFKDVFYQRSASLMNQKGDIKKLYYKSTFFLTILFLPIVLIIFLFSKELFFVIFGEEWYLTGELSKWLILWLYAVIISRPSIVLMQIFKKQKTYFKLELMGFLIKTLLFAIISILMNDYVFTIAIYSLSNIAHYLVIMFLVNRYVREYQTQSKLCYR